MDEFKDIELRVTDDMADYYRAIGRMVGVDPGVVMAVALATIMFREMKAKPTRKPPKKKTAKV